MHLAYWAHTDEDGSVWVFARDRATGVGSFRKADWIGPSNHKQRVRCIRKLNAAVFFRAHTIDNGGRPTRPASWR